MIEGDIVLCPVCEEQVPVRRKTIWNDWSVSKEVLVCAFCGHEFGEVTEEPIAEQEQRQNDAVAKLSALFGEDVVEEKKEFFTDEEVAPFCRNCAHFMAHPYRTLCALTELDVDPGGDCPKFEKRELKK